MCYDILFIRRQDTETDFVTILYNENYQKQVLKVKKEVLEAKKEVLEAEKEVLKTKKEALKVKKEALEEKKEVLKAKKEVFDNLVSNMDGNTRTEENAYRIIAEFVMGETFAR